MSAVLKAGETIADPVPLSAADRLEASRSRLRTAMLNIVHPPPRASMFADVRFGGLFERLTGKAKSIPGVAVVSETLQSWWRDHPLRTAGVMAGEASRTLVVPLARRNPMGLVGAAVVGGALLWWVKPWRWLLKPALLAGLLPQLASHAMKRIPMETWLRMLGPLSRRHGSPVNENERRSRGSPLN